MNRLNSLPTIVDAPGFYTARNGKRILVHEIKPLTGNPDHTEFAVKGSKFKTTFSGSMVPVYEIWHVSGRVSVFTESPIDIISKENK
jgi:hypothetical protein